MLESQILSIVFTASLIIMAILSLSVLASAFVVLKHGITKSVSTIIATVLAVGVVIFWISLLTQA